MRNDGTIIVNGEEITKMKGSQLTNFRRKELGLFFNSIILCQI